MKHNVPQGFYPAGAYTPADFWPQGFYPAGRRWARPWPQDFYPADKAQ